MNLSDLKVGSKGTIKGIAKDCPKEVHQRFLDLGFVAGATIAVHSISPLKDPIAYSIYNTIISLRKEDAQMVLLEAED